MTVEGIVGLSLIRMLILYGPGLLALLSAFAASRTAYTLPIESSPSSYTSSSLISITSKRVDGDGDTAMDDADQSIPAPASGPSYADWMKKLYDMGGKARRDDLGQYKTTVSQEEIDAWMLAQQGPNGYAREIGD